MGVIDGLTILRDSSQGYASLCFIGSELRLFWFWEDLALAD